MEVEMTSTTQFEGFSSGEVCDVVIGLDFGTSCCKVVIRTPYHNAGRAYAVPFDAAGHATCRYLLPSVLWLGNDGRTSLRRINNGRLLRDIKYYLMRAEAVPTVDNGKQSVYDAKTAAVVFVASALRVAREWFLTHQQELYGRYKLRWTFNIGLPSEDFADEALCSAYRDIASAAWCLSVIAADTSLAAAEEVLSSCDTSDGLREDDSAEISIVPEVAAEVAGHARSPLRDEGLHILVDIGATTLDVCSFILHQRDGDDCYELLTADVRRLGASILYQERVSAVRKAVDAHTEKLRNSYDPVCAIPDEVGAYAPRHDAIAASIQQNDKDYGKCCVRSIWSTIIDLKTKRDPRSSRWHSQMPMFLSGGGSAMLFYQSLVANLSKQLSEFYTTCHGIRRLSLAKPDNFEANVKEDVYHRLAVAWGLSYPETDIGDVCRPDDIEDVAQREVYDWRAGFVSKDMV